MTNNVLEGFLQMIDTEEREVARVERNIYLYNGECYDERWDSDTKQFRYPSREQRRDTIGQAAESSTEVC